MGASRNFTTFPPTAAFGQEYDMNGEDLLEQALSESMAKHTPNRAIDPFTIQMIIQAIFEGIRLCSDRGSAARQIRRGKSTARVKLYKMFRKNGYSRAESKDLSEEMAKRGRDLSEEEIQAILSDATDMPEPKPSPPGTSFWPTWSLVFILTLTGLCGPSQAADWWPIYEEPSAQFSVDDMWPSPEEPEAKPRSTRALFFKTDNCHWCDYQERNAFPILKEAGFTIGPEPSNHIQVINDEALASKYNITAYPTMVMLVDGKETSRFSDGSKTGRYIGMWHNYNVDPFEYPNPNAPAKVVQKEKPSRPNLSYGGPRWSFSGGDDSYHLSRHLVANHGYTMAQLRGKSNAELIAIHSRAHNTGRVGRRAVRKTAPTRRYYRSGCPNGRCPR